MTDLVVTCPKGFWLDWINEGDPAGTPWSGQQWGWFLGSTRPPIERGERLYIVAWGKLRGWAPVSRLARNSGLWVISREGNAVACTIPEPIPGFRGWRKVWWLREIEVPFPDWKTAGVGKPPAFAMRDHPEQQQGRREP